MGNSSSKNKQNSKKNLNKSNSKLNSKLPKATPKKNEKTSASIRNPVDNIKLKSTTNTKTPIKSEPITSKKDKNTKDDQPYLSEKITNNKYQNTKQENTETPKKDDVDNLNDERKILIRSGGDIRQEFQISRQNAKLSEFIMERIEDSDFVTNPLDKKSTMLTLSYFIRQSLPGYEEKFVSGLQLIVFNYSRLLIDIEKVGGETLSFIVQYLDHHKGIEPPALPCPVRSTQMDQIVSDPWDASFIDPFNKKQTFELILGANEMKIQCLLHLGCAKIATLIKQLDQKEINRIIEEEEQYRALELERQHEENEENEENEQNEQNEITETEIQGLESLDPNEELN